VSVCACSNTDTYVEPLDSTRIHPETYDWARKMAVDALEYDDTAEDANPAGALEEILDSPDRLKDLDLDAFAVELERQVHHTTLHYTAQFVVILTVSKYCLLSFLHLQLSLFLCIVCLSLCLSVLFVL